MSLPRRLAFVACATLPAACFNPTAQGETSGVESTSEGPGESTSSASSSTGTTTSAETPTTSGEPGPTTGGPGDGTTEALTSSTSDTSSTTEPQLEESYCGDGLVDPESNEACDDGNFLNDDGCTNFCQVASCGDDFVSPGEVCDDGNAMSGDGCDSTCQCERTACGDGVVGRGEECDDRNTRDDDGCSSCCERLSYNVFVSSKQFVGDGFGGPLGGDAACSELAAAAGLPGTYQAWLAFDRGLAAPAGQIFPHPYVLPGTSEVVAHSLQELRSGQLAAAIHITETGEDIGTPPADPCLEPAFRVWTGTDSSGSGVWNATCSNWTTQEEFPNMVGRFGAAGVSGPTWASCEMDASCDMMARLYCFEVQT